MQRLQFGKLGMYSSAACIAAFWREECLLYHTLRMAIRVSLALEVMVIALSLQY